MAKYLDSTGVRSLWSKIKSALGYKADGISTMPIVHIDESIIGSGEIDVTEYFKNTIPFLYKTDNNGDITYNFSTNSAQNQFLVSVNYVEDYMLGTVLGTIYYVVNSYEGDLWLIPTSVYIPGMSYIDLSKLVEYKITINGEGTKYEAYLRQNLSKSAIYSNYKTIINKTDAVKV